MDNSCFFFFSPPRFTPVARDITFFFCRVVSFSLTSSCVAIVFFEAYSCAFHSFRSLLFFFFLLSLSLNNKSGRHSGISSQSSQFHVSKATTTPTTSEKRLISPASPFRFSLVRVHFLSVSTLYHYHHDAAEAGQRAEAARSGREA